MVKKNVLVTGASSGFGEAIARKFLSEGHRLILVARRKERLISLVDEFDASDRCLIIGLDVRDRKKIDQEITGLPVGFKRVDILVNNAGLALGLGPAETSDPEYWEMMIDTNIKGMLYFSRSILPGMVERRSGHIVNIGSIAATWPYPGGNVYGGTKAFVQQFSRNLRCDLVGRNIRVSLVEPGMSETEFSIVRFKGDREKAKSVYEKMKPIVGEDIAETVFWLTSMPEHINVNQIEIMPVAQAWSPFSVHRE